MGVLSCLTDEMRNQSSNKLYTREAAKQVHQGPSGRVWHCTALTERMTMADTLPPSPGPHAASPGHDTERKQLL